MAAAIAPADQGQEPLESFVETASAYPVASIAITASIIADVMGVDRKLGNVNPWLDSILIIFSTGSIVKGTSASFQSCPTAMPTQAMTANAVRNKQAVNSILLIEWYYSNFRIMAHREHGCHWECLDAAFCGSSVQLYENSGNRGDRPHGTLVFQAVGG